jgi:signal transduction histidine kinase
MLAAPASRLLYETLERLYTMTTPLPWASTLTPPELLTALETLESACLADEARQAFMDVQKHLLHMEQITQIDQELDSQLELERVVESLSGWSLRAGSASRGWILLAGSSSAGASPEDGPTLSDPAVETALIAGEPELLSLPEQGLWRLITPLMHHGQSLGAIIVDRPAPFGSAEIAFYQRLGRRAASAVENARLYAAVQSANQAKTKFVSVVTHELRIPMTSIKGYTDLLRKGLAGEMNEMQLSFLNTIRSNVERMAALVSDLSDISRIETGRISLQPAEMVLANALEEAVQTLRPRIDEKRQTLSLHLAQDLPRVHADSSRVIQILINLLSNANKYTPEEGWIEVKAAAHPDGVRVEVNDSGIGIQPEDQRKLFSQFFRSEDQAVRDQPGWGLGLHVTRLLVEVMGGSIGVESAAGQGSQFWFTLPASSC